MMTHKFLRGAALVAAVGIAAVPALAASTVDYSTLTSAVDFTTDVIPGFVKVGAALMIAAVAYKGVRWLLKLI